MNDSERSRSSPNVERPVKPNLRVFSESTPLSISPMATRPARFCARATPESALRTVSVVSKTPPPVTNNFSPTNPWDLGVRNFAGGGSFDMQNAPLSNDRQVALGAGVTYYLRPDHHTEPPNMFAPYWHATLGRLTIDRPGVGPARAGYDAEVTTMLDGTGQTEASTAYNMLTQQGFLVTE